MAQLKFLEDSLYHCLCEWDYCLSNVVGESFNEVTKEVEVQYYGNVHVAFIENIHNPGYFPLESWNQVLITDDCVKSISALHSDNFLLLGESHTSKQEVDCLQEGVVVSSEKHVCKVT